MEYKRCYIAEAISEKNKKKKSMERTEIFLQTWKDYIPKETNCEICGKKIYFSKVEKKEMIHLDHKNDHIPIKSPRSWLKSHKLTFENQKIWGECDFGMLCSRCNRFLPTKNREEFIGNAVKYVFGKDFNVCDTRIQG